MTVMAPYSRDNKMYEAIITEMDESAGTAKVKFANVSIVISYDSFVMTHLFSILILTQFLFHNYPILPEKKLNVEGKCYYTCNNCRKTIISRWQAEPKSARAPLPSTVMDNDVGINTKAAREKARIEIEKRRKKAAKKKERLAAMDAAGERQKKSWQSFNNKVVKKKKAGVVRIIIR